MERYAFVAVCAAVGAMSLLTFLLYGADKRRAVKDRWRIPEKVLLSCSFFGGAAGGTLGMILFRHKTKKAAFVLVNAAGLLWQAAALVCAAVFLT